MASKSKRTRTRTGLQFMGLLKTALEREEGEAMATLCHRLPIAAREGGLPTIYTVYLTPDARGTFLVTCGEFPSVTTFGQDEEEALARAELAIREAIGGGPIAPDLPS